MKRNKGRGRCDSEKQELRMVKESKIMDCICRFESPLRVREWGFWMNSER